jgi:hypothetical protein
MAADFLANSCPDKSAQKESLKKGPIVLRFRFACKPPDVEAHIMDFMIYERNLGGRFGGLMSAFRLFLPKPTSWFRSFPRNPDGFSLSANIRFCRFILNAPILIEPFFTMNQQQPELMTKTQLKLYSSLTNSQVLYSQYLRFLLFGFIL